MINGEQGSLKDADTKGKLWYIWEYYKIHIAVGIFAIGVIIYIIYRFLNPAKETVLNAALLNFNGTSIETDEEFEDFLDTYGFDTNKETVTVVSNIVMNADENDDSDVESMQVFLTRMMAGQLDLVIGDEASIEYLTELGGMDDLSEYVSEEYLEKYADYIYYGTDEDTGEEYPAGFILGSNGPFMEYANFDTEAIGIMAAGENKEAAGEAVEYFLDSCFE